MADISEQSYARMASATGVLNCIALVFLILASALPLFVMTSVKGEYNVWWDRHHWIDFHVGNGIFQRNVCYGHDRPKESLLNKFGLTCEGHSQLNKCNASPDERDPKFGRHHCHDFRYMQTMAVICIVATALAMFFATRTITMCCGPNNQPAQWVERFGAALVTVIAIAACAAVIGRVQESDMVKFVDEEETWKCRKVLGVELCHGYGASYYLQSIALALLLLALVGNVVMVAGAGQRRASLERDEPLMRGGGRDVA